MVASVGALARMAIKAALPFDGTAGPLEFQGEDLRATKIILDTAGIRGTRSRGAERTRAGTYKVSGSIRLTPSPAELNGLLQYIMGGTPQVGTPAGKTTFPLAESIPQFQVMIDRVAKVFTYTDCKITKALFRAGEGTPLEVILDVEGLTESVGAAGTFPALTLPTDGPFVFMDGVVTLSGTSRQIKSLEIALENKAETERFLNSVTRKEVPIIDRGVSLKCTVPYESVNTDLYDQAATGGAADVTFTNGSQSLQFSFPGQVQFPAVSPIVSGKGEILLELSGTARRKESAPAQPELSIVLDSTG